MDYYKEINFDRETFDSWKCVRLKCLKKRIEDGTLNADLRVIGD